MNIRRLRADQVRDAMLAATGELDLTVGGEGVDSSAPRRSIYVKVLRNAPDMLLEAFDAADGFNSTTQRATTTTANQALLLFNGPWLSARAKAMKGRLERDALDDHQFIDVAWRRSFGRAPTTSEREASLRFLREQAQRIGTNPPSLNDDPPPVAVMPRREGQAADVSDTAPRSPLVGPAHSALPAGDFTIEAFVLLRSLYDDASVRVIASQWNGDNNSPGWSLGVTSKGSKHTPQNLILQLVGDDGEGKRTYEVVPSDLRIELDKPYYVAAAVKIDETESPEATFYVKELAATDKPLQTVHAALQVRRNYRGSAALVLGGRDGKRSHWDGLLDDVRLSSAALAAEELLANNTAPRETTVGLWRFEAQSGFYADESGRDHRLEPAERPSPSSQTDPHAAARIDFCHVLLNSSEFLYVE
jgi:hypothetical protein